MEEPGQEGSAPLDQAPRSQRAAPPAETLCGGPAAPVNPYSNSAVKGCARRLRTVAGQTVAACQWLRDKQARDPAADVAATAEVLAALAERSARQKGIRLENTKGPQLRRMCENRRSDTALIKAAAAALGWSAADLAADAARLKQAEELVEEFKQAIGQDKGLSLASRPDKLSVRMTTFAANRLRPDSDIRAHLMHILRDEWARIAPHLPKPTTRDRRADDREEARRRIREEEEKNKWIGRCVAALPMPYLRTCPDELLATLGVNFACWNPLVQYLKARPAARKAANPGTEDQLKDLMRRVTLRLYKRFPKKNPQADIQGAVSCIVLKSLEEIRRSRCGYRYEGSLLAWVFVGAMRILLRLVKGKPVQEVNLAAADDDGKDFIDGSPAPPDDDAMEAECFDRFIAFHERVQIVKTFFRCAAWERIAGWLEAMLRDFGVGPSPLHTVPASGAQKPAPQAKKTSTEAVTIHRFRQRMRALDYIRDRVPKGWPDEPGDESVLRHVAPKGGGPPAGDVTTIRGVTSLARAASQDTTLTSVYLVRRFVEKPRSISIQEIREEGLSLIQGWADVHTGDPEQMEKQLEEMCALMKRSRKRVAAVRNLARRKCGAARKALRKKWQALNRDKPRPKGPAPKPARKGRRWDPMLLRIPCYEVFVGPCWYLKVVRGKTLDEVFRILKPAEHERAILKEIYEGL